jgi:hypothetical protein
MGILGPVVGAILGSQSTTSAANTSADATTNAANAAAAAQNHATDVANQQYQQTRSDFEPFRTAGVNAIPAFNEAINSKFTYDPTQSPSASYQLEKGSQALNRALASRGLSGSGMAANRLGELNRSVAANDYQTGYNNAYTQWNNQYSRILDALKLGTGASTSMGAASNNLTNATQAGATNLGNIAQSAGTNLANIYMNQGNNQASLYSGLAGQGSNQAALGLKLLNSNRYNYNNNNNQLPYPGAEDMSAVS